MNEANSVLERLFSLRGKAALITGASGGIGRALAVGLAEAGAAVALHGRSEEQLEETRRLVENTGGKAVVLPAELGDLEAAQRLIKETCKALDSLDILINCAGMNRRKPAAEATPDDFDAIIAANLRSLYFLCQAAYPLMRDAGGGKIINIGSITSTYGLGGVSVYGMTKSAVGQLTKTLAVEWAKDNIQVNCLAPGFIVTPLTETSVWGDEQRRNWLLSRIPAKRPGQPEELVGVALLMASPASSYLTGQLITVDGGFLAGGWWDQE